MFSKLIKKVFKETTNISDVSPVTFNTSGNYNPRYGKHREYVTGRGGDGSNTAGTANYNTVAGTANYNTVAGTANYNTVAGTANYNTVAGTDVYYSATGNAVYYSTGGNANYNTVAGTPNYYTPTYVPATSNSTANYTNQSGGTIYGSYVNETSFSSNNYSTYGQGPVNAGSAYSAGYNTWYRTTTYQYYSAIAFFPGNNANYNSSTPVYNSPTAVYNAATPGTVGNFTVYMAGFNFTYVTANSGPTTPAANAKIAVSATFSTYYTNYTYTALYSPSQVPAPTYTATIGYNQSYGLYPKNSYTVPSPGNYAGYYYTAGTVSGIVPALATGNNVNNTTGNMNAQNVANYNAPNAYSAFRLWYNVEYLTVYDSNAFTQLGNVSGNNNPSYPYANTNAVNYVLWYYNTNYPYWYTNLPTYPYANTNATTYPYANTNATTYPYANTNATTYPYANTNATTYLYANTNATTYLYANTNAATANTGPSINVLGVTIPGGYGGAGNVLPDTLVTSIPSYGTTTSVTVPTGGYVTIKFTL